MKRTVLLFAIGLLSIASVMAGGNKEPAHQIDPVPPTPVEQAPTAKPIPAETTPVPAVPSEQTPVQTTPSPALAPVQPSSPFYNGSGGNGSSIAILPPKGVGLENNLAYLPELVQHEFANNFSGYSAIRVLNRATLDDQFAELLSGYYPDDMEGVITLGHLPPTTYIMVGRITKTATGYALQITIAKTSDGTTEASYSGTCTVAELDNFTGIRRASLELLEKMEIELTERTRTELSGSAAPQTVNAQTALAQGITAQRSGTVVEALSYYIQSNSYDPGLAEAASRMNILSANITSGNIGQNVRNDLQWRDQWVARLKECEDFYAKYTKDIPPYYLVYSTDIKQGAVDYAKRTAALSFTVGLYPDVSWFETLDKVVGAVKQGLNATGRAKVWGLDTWPERQSVSMPTPFKDTFFSYMAKVEILDEGGKSIGSQDIEFPAGCIFYYAKQNGANVSPYKVLPVGGETEILFPAVAADSISDTLMIRITSIDGIPAADITKNARLKNLNIMTLNDFNGVPGSAKSRTQTQQQWEWDKRDGLWRGSANGANFDIVYIPYGVTSIGEKAFYDKYLTRVLIPNSVTSIGKLAFCGNRLTSVTIPDRVTSIGDQAFDGNNLPSVTIPNSITYIGLYAFHNLYQIDRNLTSITIGANVRLHYSTGPGVFFSSPPNVYTAFDDGFDDFYNRNGKKAGTYTRPNSDSKEWSFTPR